MYKSKDVDKFRGKEIVPDGPIYFLFFLFSIYKTNRLDIGFSSMNLKTYHSRHPGANYFLCPCRESGIFLVIS